MPNTHGRGPGEARAVLYARVSTDEQARSGYSLAQQIEALRAYAADEGYEVLEEVSDPGQSGASLERPGMDRVRDLVAAGGVDMVLAQDRDRYAREPAYLYLLREEFARQGCGLRSLNDRGDDSPEGELTDGILDQLAKYERAKTAERTRRGKVRKVKEGKLLAAGPRPRFGFRLDETRTGYEVNPEEMRVVRRVFRMVGEEANPMRGVARTLEQEGVPAPNGGKRWSTTTLRNILLDDVYRPHAYSEVEPLVSPTVAATLDRNELYGISWWGVRRTSAKRPPNGARDYRKLRQAEPVPRERWIAVPVVDSGLSRDLVDAARAAVGSNARTSSAGGRDWDLSGGVFCCGGCGLRMTPSRRRRKPGTAYYNYYRCETKHNRGSAACPLPRSYRAEEVEEMVWQEVRGLVSDPERLRADLERLIEEERSSTRGAASLDEEAKVWTTQLADLDRKRSGYLDLAADGIVGRAELRDKLGSIEEAGATARGELEALAGRRERIEGLERDKDAMLEHYARLAPEALDDLDHAERNRFYKLLRLKVTATPEGGIELGYGQGVCKHDSTCS